jgi:hypothetical protein
LSKPCKNLLWLGAAEPQPCPLTLIENAGTYRKMGVREKLPSDSNSLVSKDIWQLRRNELTGLK